MERTRKLRLTEDRYIYPVTHLFKLLSGRTENSPDSLQRKGSNTELREEGRFHWPSSVKLSRCLVIAICFKKGSQGYAESSDIVGRNHGSGSS